MSENSRHAILHEDVEVGVLYEMPWHGQVCLHTEDADLVNLLLEEGLVVPRRPPFLDAAEDGVHGGYRPRPQINLFFDEPLAEVVETLRPPLERAGWSVASTLPPKRG
ncbi:MAG: hypothetical protein KY397_04945 [Gemmatimonadetes bacterium]|nr:hypothetical protein [Gemmatimonadota bacterium]